jgi:flagellar hook-basal body protein
MAGFNTAVTGLKAATTELDVTGNNIANASTIGFKSSRTEFGDIYATAVVGAGSSNVAGAGVTVTDIAQDFQAGTIEFTNNNLDLAINGSGFFQLDDGQGGTTYTRAGAFELDKEGSIVSKSGNYLQGYGLDDAGNRLPIGDLSVTQKESPPAATESIGLSFNIDSRDDADTLLQPYDKDEPASFTYTTTVRTFDSLGNEQTIKFNLVEQPALREVQTLDFSAYTPGMTGDVQVSGVDVDLGLIQKAYGLDPDEVTIGFVTDVDVTGTVANPVTTGDEVDVNIGTWSLNTQLATDGDPLLTATADFATDADVASFIAANSDTIVAAYNGQAASPSPALIDIVIDPTSPSGLLFRYDNSADATQTISIANDTESEVLAPTTVAADNHDVNQELADLLAGDDRISSIQMLGTSSDADQIQLRFKASATDVDEVQVRNSTNAAVLSDVTNVSTTLTASEVHTYAFSSAAFDPSTGNLTSDTKVTIGGVEIQLSAGSSQSVVQDTIGSSQAAIIDANPEVQAVQFNSSGQLIITFEPESGNVNDGVLAVDFGDGDATATGLQPVMTRTAIDAGDSSYQGKYRMYAYLNGTEQLDIGKATDPGEPGTTEPGPIILSFDSTNGLLNEINGASIPLGGAAPSIAITGSDPADPTTTVALDISNTTQFASESIVKASAQDGYSKGDLIGVTFSGTGEMVASFSNGQNQSLGVVAIATFENQSGLQPSGDTEWSATLTSGDPIVNPPGTGLNGTLQSAALEQSNVDLSAELVALIEAQRNFQANSKTLETLNTVTQNILQI